MAEDRPRSGHSPTRDGKGLNFLPSTFSPWGNYERISEDADGEYNLDHIAANISRPTTAASRQSGSPDMDNQARQGSPVSNQGPTSTPDLTVTPPASARPFETRQPPESLQEPESPPRPTAPPRKSRFREMLNSLSSGRKGGRRSPNPNFIRAMSEDFSYHGGQPSSMEPEHARYDELGGRIHYFDGPTATDLPNLYSKPPTYCHARKDVYVGRWTWLFTTILCLSIYSTAMSGLWLVVAFYQPRYGRGISSSIGPGIVAPSTASLLSTLVAKTIEMSFVTVFVAFVGQVLTRRSFIRRSRGVTLAEMTMRNWVIQPGSLLTYWEGIPWYAAPTFLGALTLTATLASLLYTTASDAMVRPKIKFGDWHQGELQGLVRSSYLNPFFVGASCTTPIDEELDTPQHAAESCLNIEYSGQSYRNLLGFMETWKDIHDSGISREDQLDKRPTGKHNLLDNTTMASSWIDTGYADVAANFATHNRIINNVTLAMPHPGVYAAATDPVNNILQPNELIGLGQYSLIASVVSPALNVMCVNAASSELAPLVYDINMYQTAWPNARNQSTGIGGHNIGEFDWYLDVPVAKEGEWLNRTVVDDIFRWGPDYGRMPPVFQLYPIAHNMVVNMTVTDNEAVYILMKSNFTDLPDYTLCELRSWVSTRCSTRFDVSGTSGGQMAAHCNDPDDPDAYHRVVEDVEPWMSPDFKYLINAWQLSMNINGGITNNNASNARVLTQLILREPALDPLLPSLAEALAVYASSTLAIGSVQTTYKHYWDHPANELDPGVYEAFRASVRTQEYTSTYEEDWQRGFYVVLLLVFLLNAVCLVYLLLPGGGLVTDYTEPQNLFALAVNSPPSAALAGSCGGGPNLAEMVAPWRVSYAEDANHYFFEEAGHSPVAKRAATFGAESVASGLELPTHAAIRRGRFSENYKRLSTSRPSGWL